MLRATFAFSLFFIFILCFYAAAGSAAGGEANPQRQAWVEQDVDRPGSDFQILWLRGGPEGCQAACAQHPLCRSYTYVRPGIPGRPEGCWLKNGIPPPVADGCCVSGVKTEESVAGILRQPPVIYEEAVSPDRAPEPAIAPEAPLGGNDGEKEKVLVTGSGKRTAAELRFTAIPPAASSTFKAGAGRKMAGGMDFTAVPQSASSPGSKSVAGAKFPFTGRGLRKVAGVRYTATAPAGTHPPSDVPLPGGATRTVSGVDIAAVPPRR
jgi:PAN domain